MSHRFAILSGILFCYTRIAQGDMCQDFCLKELGRTGCSKGSWCKNNYDCQSLFFTSADRTSICVFTGSGSCTNTFPVLCSDARGRIEGGIAKTRTTKLPPMTGRSSEFQLPKPKITTIMPQTTMKSTGYTDQTIYQKASPVTISLHYGPNYQDLRPRITMSFKDNVKKIGFSVLFDTGSEKSHILECKGTKQELEALENAPPSYGNIDGIDHSAEPVTRPAKLGEGYQKGCHVQQTGEARVLLYGPLNKYIRFESNCRIKESAILFSGKNSFTFPIEIDLTRDVHFHGVGLLGAAPSSHFANTVGIFSYLGPPIDSTVPTTRSAGTLFIGERDESILKSHCLEGHDLKFVPWVPEISLTFWGIRGSLTMDNESRNETVTSNMDWIIDSGADGSFVTREMLAAIKQAMLDNGAVIHPGTPGYMDIYRNCPSPKVMPKFTFHLGTGPEAVLVVITAKDYIRATDSSGWCYLRVKDDTVLTPSIGFISRDILSKLLTVFDAENHRIGFCNSRP